MKDNTIQRYVTRKAAHRKEARQFITMCLGILIFLSCCFGLMIGKALGAVLFLIFCLVFIGGTNIQFIKGKEAKKKWCL